QMVIGEGSGPVNVQQNFHNIELFGLTGSKILKEIGDIENDKLYSESITPKLEVIGDYDMNGRILVLPIRGKGKFNITLINSRLTHNLTMEKYSKKNKTYWKILDYIVTIQPEKMHYQFDNLFDGDARLGNEINKVINENWESVYSDVRSGYEKSFGLIFKGLAESLFSRVPYNQIFLVE
ncbi:hemolymph juvenile hormone-binding protein, partial [Oryctes borbonicus]